MRHWIDDEDDDEEGAEPWALGDDEPEPLDRWDGGGEAADRWLEEQLDRVGSPALDDGECAAARSSRPEPSDSMLGGGGGVVLRCSAPTRAPRRRQADAEAAGDLPAPFVSGYVRDRRGTWRYAVTGRAVPGARDLTLRALCRFAVHRGQVLVPVDLVRTEAELAWCMAWKHTLTTSLQDGHLRSVLRVPAGEWERRADVPFGLWAPELTPTRLLAVGDVARLVGVSAATITAYLSRGRMPAPVARLGTSPVWSRPVISQWLASRPGQGARPRR
jgi:predicted DNA-binding transcriptional regulator AlpA